jgi:hypothetical protein
MDGSSAGTGQGEVEGRAAIAPLKRVSMTSLIDPEGGPHAARTHGLLVATGCALCVALALALVLLR